MVIVIEKQVIFPNGVIIRETRMEVVPTQLSPPPKQPPSLLKRLSDSVREVGVNFKF